MDAAYALSAFMVDSWPDPVRFTKAIGNLILTSAKASKGDRPHVALDGEGVHLLWAQGDERQRLKSRN